MDRFKSNEIIKPNFFIVGAPKCGTTAMNDYLACHNDIFMIEKELHFFGRDLMVKERISEAEYLKRFAAGSDKKIRGEASVWYLYSETAASEIREFSPDAKILIMLRNPVDVIYSLHSQHLYDGNEDVKDFETALGLDDLRKKGERRPDAVDFFEVPAYKDSVMFSRQVKRYFDFFGKNNVHVIVYDDFVTNTKKTLLDTFLFLELNSGAEIKTTRINANKRIKNFWMHRLLKKPPSFLKKIARTIIPVRNMRHNMMRGLFKWNIEVIERDKMSDGVHSKLKQELTDEIYLLEKLLGRDLSAWRR